MVRRSLMSSTMLVMRKRTFSLIVMLLLALFSFWLFLQNFSLTNNTPREQNNIKQMLLTKHGILSKRPTVDKKIIINVAHFNPPPKLENEEHSEGYTLEDAYFRRWQKFHNVEPKRPVKKPLANPRDHRRGWADLGYDINSPHIKAHMEKMKERQRQLVMLREKHYGTYINRTFEAKEDWDPDEVEDADIKIRYRPESSDDDDGDDDGEEEEKPPLSNLHDEWLRERLNEYCNPTGATGSGGEGLGPPGYSLQEVHVIARHGDRTPMEDISADLNLDQKVKWECSLKVASKKVNAPLLKRFVAFMQRERHRLEQYDDWLQGTVLKIPTRDWSWDCANAQLTPLGWLQHMKLGEYMRVRYALKLGLDSSTLRRKDCCSFRSTTNTRTLQSATAFMYGFLPVFVLTDIERIQASGHVNFCQSSKCQCSAYRELYDKTTKVMSALSTRGTIQELDQEISNVMFNSTNHPSEFPANLVEHLSARSCHNKPLPCNNKGCVSEKMFSDLFETVDSIATQARSYDKNVFERYGRLYMYPLLFEIISRMQERIAHGGGNQPKFNVYIGHDITVTPLKDALGIKDSKWPGYAARIVFELWKNPTNLYTVRILYNGRDVTKITAFCRESRTASKNCPFDRFFKYVSEDLLGMFNVTTFKEACALKL